jgi:hypothetical protein
MLLAPPARIFSANGEIIDNINTIDSGQRRELVGFYDEMPVWPSVDSIKMVDTVFLVKLGERQLQVPYHALMLIVLQRYNLNVHSLFGMKILLIKL